MNPSDWQPDIVIYHDHCADGFAAAWACWTRWGDACTYIPASYGQSPPDVTGKNVLLVDFSYKKHELERLAGLSRSIVVLDHHKTAQADLVPFQTFADRPERFTPAVVASMVGDLARGGWPAIVASFDMDRSGARMAWNFCYGPDTESPHLIDLVEDRDLWRFVLPDSKPFALWLRSEPFSFDRFDMLAQELGDARDNERIMTEARAMQRFFDAKVDEIASFARRRRIGEHEAVVVNCPPMFASDVGHALLDKHPEAPFVATYFDGPNSRMWSLRSRDDRVDVSAVAQRFGGGGHRNAAGFSSPL